MKQTAVEWFALELYEKFEMKGDGKVFDELLNQAKEMEKEMMNKNIKFICHGCGTKHTGENDDQMYEVCKQCFTNL